jgi:hypothetical protein
MKRLVGLTALSLVLMAGAVMGQVGYPAWNEISYTYQGGNPAGIWVIESPMVSASYKIFRPAGKYTQTLTPVATENSLDISTIGDFSFVAPVRIKGHPYVLNFNYNHFNENIIEEQFYGGFFADSITNQFNPDISSSDESYMRDYSFGFSTRVYRQLSFGATANIYDGRRLKKSVYQAAWTDTVSVINGIFNDQYRQYTTMDSTLSNGFNLIFGLMYKLEKVNVGAVVRTPFTMKHTTDYSLFQVATTNGLGNILYSDTTYVQDSLAKQQVPLSVGLGVGFFPKANLILALDLTYYRYGSTNWFYRDSTFFSASGKRTDYYTEVPIDWNNTFGVGAGVEYLLSTPYGQVPLRAGFRYDQLPQPKKFVDDYSYTVVESDTVTTINRIATDRQTMVSLSLGTGIHWSLINLDLAYRYSTGAETDQSETSGGLTFWSNKLEQKTHEVRCTFTGFF